MDKGAGKQVFILRKYDSIPLSKKEIYSSKLKIIINYLATLLLGDILIYGATMIFNSYLEINIWKNIIELLLVFLLSAFLICILLVLNLIQDNKTKKQI